MKAMIVLAFMVGGLFIVCGVVLIGIAFLAGDLLAFVCGLLTILMGFARLHVFGGPFDQ